MLYQLIYASSAVKEFSNEELLSLLTRSRENNSARDVTGMLLYKDGNFLQALEGDETVVTELYARISRDVRHRGHLVLLRTAVPVREFPDWSMGFRNLDLQDDTDIVGYSQLLNERFEPSSFALEPSRAKKLLRTFRRIM